MVTRSTFAVLCALLAGWTGPAQTVGLIEGRVTADGRGVAGATIQVFRAGVLEPVATSTAGPDGVFRVSGLAQTAYRVAVSAEGYLPVERTGIVVFVGMATTLDVELRRLDPAGSAEVSVRLLTAHGIIVMAVDVKRAPVTATNFLRYVDAGLYDNGRFHRATRLDNYTAAPPDRPMMELIQGGIDPAKRDRGFPPIRLERTSVTGLRHVAGTVSMARGTAADTATSDFFILLDDQPSLDFGGRRFEDGQGAAAFGRVTAGMDVVRRIQQRPVKGQNLTPPVSIYLAVRATGRE